MNDSMRDCDTRNVTSEPHVAPSRKTRIIPNTGLTGLMLLSPQIAAGKGHLLTIGNSGKHIAFA